MTIHVDVALRRGEFDLQLAFDAPGSGFTAVFGPSGCGKTTLLRTIAGLEPLARGSVRVAGQSWLDTRHHLPAHRRPVGFVFQQPMLFRHLDVRGNLSFGMRRRRDARSPLAFDRVVELMGLTPLLARRVTGLSGGETQRVAIAQALLSKPRLLLMDEPLSALDQASRSILLAYLEQMQHELDIPVLYVSHALDEVTRLTRHMVLIDEGRLVTSGPLNELLTRFDLPMAHGRNAESVIHVAVGASDPRDGLSELTFAGGRLWVPAVDLPPGTRLPVRLRANDVSLALGPVTGTSIVNSFPVIVADIYDAGPAQVTVRLQAGSDVLLARVTRRSLRQLDITPGKSMYAQVKSVALTI